MLTYVDICVKLAGHVFSPVDTSVCEITGMLTNADVCWRVLTYAEVCWRMLAYADYVWEIADFPRQANSVLWDLKGTQFTCFTSTKV